MFFLVGNRCWLFRSELLAPLAIAVRTEGGGGVRFDLLIRSGPRDNSSRDDGVVTVTVSACTTPDTDPVPVPVAPPDIWETMVRLWLLLNPVSFHFSETNLNRDLVESSRQGLSIKATYLQHCWRHWSSRRGGGDEPVGRTPPSCRPSGIACS